LVLGASKIHKPLRDECVERQSGNSYMIFQSRVIPVSVAILTLFVNSPNMAMQGEHVSISKQAEVFTFAADTQLLNDSNESYGKRASVDFPDNPTDYFFGVELAREKVRKGDCKGAVPLLERAIKDYSDHGNVRGLLGKCRAEVGKWKSAAEAYKKALQLGVQPWDFDLDLNPNDMMIKIAGVYAQAGNQDKALIWLRRGLDARYDERPDIADAPEFANLHDNDEFKNLAALPPEKARSRDEEWRYDIASLRQQVAMLHADADQLTKAVELERVLSDLSLAVPNLSDQQVTAQLDLFIGSLGGGHDLFWPVYPERGAMLPFALKIYLFTDGLYIIDAYDPQLIGFKIDLFGKTPAAEAYEIVANAFPGDNDMQARWMGVRHLTQAFTLEALGIIDDAGTATLTVSDKTGQRVITPERRGFTSMSPALKAPPGVAVPLYLSRMEDNYWIHRLDDLSALYVQLKIVANGETESIAEFAKRLGEEASDPRIRNLILDLRHSPGGNGYLIPPLLRQLVHFDASPEKDRLFVIIGRNTFSASHNLITELDWIAEPIFVGEPSGSRPNTLSESGHFILPFSRLSGTLSSQLHQQSVPEDHRVWIAPQLPVGLSSEEHFSGRDPAIEAIAALIASKKTNSKPNN
jgi:tetratricopeptide (TPR) repeat protein